MTITSDRELVNACVDKRTLKAPGSPMRPADLSMAMFQDKNCRGCRFADRRTVGSGRPCCTYCSHLDTDGVVCRTRRQ